MPGAASPCSGRYTKLRTTTSIIPISVIIEFNARVPLSAILIHARMTTHTMPLGLTYIRATMPPSRQRLGRFTEQHNRPDNVAV